MFTTIARREREVRYFWYISCAVKTAELEKSLDNELPWHIHVENRNKIDAPFREKNGNHHITIRKTASNERWRSSAWGWRQLRVESITIMRLWLDEANQIRNNSRV
jgi:hypothetical protein